MFNSMFYLRFLCNLFCEIQINSKKTESKWNNLLLQLICNHEQLEKAWHFLKWQNINKTNKQKKSLFCNDEKLEKAKLQNIEKRKTFIMLLRTAGKSTVTFFITKYSENTQLKKSRVFIDQKNHASNSMDTTAYIHDFESSKSDLCFCVCVCAIFYHVNMWNVCCLRLKTVMDITSEKNDQ